MEKLRVAFYNLGCKVNAYETNAMAELLEKAGYLLVDFSEKADVYVVNTCTVTNIADRKSRQILHRARKQNQESVIVAVGCYIQAQMDREAKEVFKDIDIALGNNEKGKLPQVLEQYFSQKQSREQLIEIRDLSRIQEYEPLAIEQTTERTRAYLKVQDGCNQFCAYCAIPYVRGRVRSRAKEDVLAEVKRLASSGYREIVLTGIHLSSYGVELEGETLLGLLQKIHGVAGIQRIRLGSLEPGIITGEFVRGMKSLEKVCPHFHLSLQSGCDETLRRMNRHYRTQEYRSACELLRSVYENPALTTDVIVGFPGESEEEFARSKAFVEEMDFYETHIFKYSRRKGTKADKMPCQVAESLKNERSNEMLKLHCRQKERYERKWLNKPLQVLIEEEKKEGKTFYQTGRTREYLRIRMSRPDLKRNQLVWTTVQDPSQFL